MNQIKLGHGAFSLGAGGLALGKGVVSALRREEDGQVTVVSLSRPWTPSLTREDNGSVTVRAA